MLTYTKRRFILGLSSSIRILVRRCYVVNIPDNIRKIRVERGVTQKDFAKRVGIPYQTYNNYERGFRTPSPETLLKIAKGLGVSIEKFFEESVYETKNKKQIV